MTPVHEFTRLVELASDEMRVVHCTFAVNSRHEVKFALIGDKVMGIENLVLINTNNESIKL